MNMNPGSDDAIKAGCTCPVLDNNHYLVRLDALLNVLEYELRESF